MHLTILKKKNIGLLIVMAVLLLVGTLYASDNKFIITGRLSPQDKAMANLSVFVREQRAGAIPKKITVSKTGRFRVELDFQVNYELTFMADNHYNKIIKLSTKMPEEVLKNDSFFPPFPMEVFLFTQVPEAVDDFSMKTTGEIFYSPELDQFDAKILISDESIEEKLDVMGQQFAELVRKGDAAYEQQELASAISFYNKALLIKEDTQVEKKRNEILNQLKQGEEIIELLATAQKQFDQSQWNDAKVSYSAVLEFDKNHTLALQKISEIEDILNQLEAKKLANQEKQKSIEELLALGDKQIEQKEWQNAKASYNSIIALDASNTIAPQKIEFIDNAMQAEIELETQYKTLVAEGDEAFQNKQLTIALAKFEAALALKANEAYPKKQIDLIRRAQMDEATRQKKFVELKAKGREEMNAEKLTLAKETFEKALLIQPDQEVTAWIQIIDQTFAQQKAVESANQQYAQLIAEADALFNKKSYEEAIKRYEASLLIKTEETYPKEQIAKSTSQIQSIAQQKALESLNKQYNQVIAQADALFNKKSYTDAIQKYKSALLIKTEETYPKGQIEKIKSIVQNIEQQYAASIAKADLTFNSKKYLESITEYTAALKIKPEEDYPQDQITKAQAAISNKEELYNQTIANADKMFNEKEYTLAITQYESALKQKSTEAYPKEQITKAKNILQKTEQQYNNLIAQADRLFKAENYAESITKYEEALALKTVESYPQQQIVLAKGKISDFENLYTETIAKANTLFSKKQYAESITQYETALTMKPTEVYPKEQVISAKKMIQNIETEYKGLIAEANQAFNKKHFSQSITIYKAALAVKADEQYPNQQIAKAKAEISNTEELYKQAIAKADALFNEKNYAEAITTYKTASSIKSKEEYPQKQITLAQQAMQAIENNYRSAIKEGDRLVENKEFQQAIAQYEKAISIKENEEEPKRKKGIAEQKIKEFEMLEGSVKETIEKADNAYKKADYRIAILHYNEVLAVIPNHTYAKNQMKLAQEQIDILENSKYAEEIERYIKKAEESESHNKYQLAIQYYKKVLNLEPNSKEIKVAIDSLKTEIKKQNEAKTNTDFVKNFDLAEEASKKGNLQNALFYYKKALQFKEGDKKTLERIKNLELELNSGM